MDIRRRTTENTHATTTSKKTIVLLDFGCNGPTAPRGRYTIVTLDPRRAQIAERTGKCQLQMQRGLLLVFALAVRTKLYSRRGAIDEVYISHAGESHVVYTSVLICSDHSLICLAEQPPHVQELP